MRLENVISGSQSQHNNVNNKQMTVAMDRSAKQQSNEKDFVLHKEINRDEVEMAVSKLNAFIEPLRTDLKFQFHEKLNEYYVAVVNPLTHEVIKEIPPKKMLDMYAEMAELMGILIDQKI